MLYRHHDDVLIWIRRQLGSDSDPWNLDDSEHGPFQRIPFRAVRDLSTDVLEQRMKL